MLEAGVQLAASCPCASPPGVGPGGSVVEMCGWGELRTRGVGDASSGHTCYSPKAQQHEEGSGGQAWACCCLHWVTLRLCLTGWHEMLGVQGLAESWGGYKEATAGGRWLGPGVSWQVPVAPNADQDHSHTSAGPRPGSRPDLPPRITDQQEACGRRLKARPLKSVTRKPKRDV